MSKEQKQALTNFINTASDEAITKLYLTYAEIRGFERCDDSELLQASKEWIEGLSNNDVMELYLKNNHADYKEEEMNEDVLLECVNNWSMIKVTKQDILNWLSSRNTKTITKEEVNNNHVEYKEEELPKPSMEAQIDFRLDQMGASQETKDAILSTERDKAIFFNALFEEDSKPNTKLIQLAEDYHKMRSKQPETITKEEAEQRLKGYGENVRVK